MGRDDDKLILQSRPLVRKIAVSLAQRYGGEIDDFVQSGMIGLIDAVRRFDEVKGRNFRYYAGLRIHGAIMDEYRKLSMLGIWEREKRKKDPTRIEVGRVLAKQDFSQKHIERAVSERDEGERTHRAAAVVVQRLMRRLPARHRAVMRMRYVDDMEDPQIGVVLGVTGSRVCQLRRQAERWMRDYAKYLNVSSIDDVI